jgi:hypothetical protein
MISNTDSTILVYRVKHMRVKVYDTGIAEPDAGTTAPAGYLDPRLLERISVRTGEHQPSIFDQSKRILACPPGSRLELNTKKHSVEIHRNQQRQEWLLVCKQSVELVSKTAFAGSYRHPK